MRISTVTDTKHAGSWLTVKWRVPLFLWSEKGRRGVSRQACGAPKVIARPCVTCSPINVASYVGYESETPIIPISLSPRKSELEEAFVSLLYPASSSPSPDLVQISRGTRSPDALSPSPMRFSIIATLVGMALTHPVVLDSRLDGSTVFLRAFLSTISLDFAHRELDTRFSCFYLYGFVSSRDYFFSKKFIWTRRLSTEGNVL